MNKQEKCPTGAGMVEVFNFSHERTPVRVQLIDGEPWFVAKDVCEVLGIANHKDAVSRLDDDERGGSVLPTQFGEKLTNMVNESGLYHLIFQSRKAEARKFRKWVTGEVLPSIRRKGFYGVRRGVGDYTDVRDVPYYVMSFRGSDVRMVEVDGSMWYSLNDIHASLGVRTESTQSARHLNARGEFARKLLICGVPNPGWFVSEAGVRLLLCASMKGLRDRQLTLDFEGKEVAR